jgi:hypothetical protein
MKVIISGLVVFYMTSGTVYAQLPQGKKNATIFTAYQLHNVSMVINIIHGTNHLASRNFNFLVTCNGFKKLCAIDLSLN